MMADTTDADKATKKLIHAGIPKAECLDDMDEFMAREENQTIDAALKNLDEQHSKYKFMELNLLQKKQRLKSQIPEIKTSLEIIKLLKLKRDSSEDMETRFVLSDQVYSKAVIPPTERVCLWLGANVMLEYSLEGAEELLCKNLQTATRNFTELNSDLDFLRDQITTTEVIALHLHETCLREYLSTTALMPPQFHNMARLHNWNVKKVQAEKLIAQSST